MEDKLFISTHTNYPSENGKSAHKTTEAVPLSSSSNRMPYSSQMSGSNSPGENGETPKKVEICSPISEKQGRTEILGRVVRQQAGKHGLSNVVEVPLIRRIFRRNRFIEVPEVHVIEKIHPKIQIQEVLHKVQRPEIRWIEKVIEVPEIRWIDRNIEVPDIVERIKFIPKPQIQEIIKTVPKFETVFVEKLVEVPQVRHVLKIIEVPEIREITKFVEKLHVVEVPVHSVKHVPRLELRKVEKIRHIQGPIQYVDVPVHRIVHKPVYETVEKIVEVPEVQEILVETPMVIPSPNGSIIDIPVEYPVFYDIPQYRKVPGKIIHIEKEKIIEKIVEIPVPVHQETRRVVKVPLERKIEIVKEVEVPQYVDEIIEVPKYVPVLAPPPIIMPVPQDEIIEVDPIYEKASPRYIYEPPVYAPPVYETLKSETRIVGVGNNYSN